VAADHDLADSAAFRGDCPRFVGVDDCVNAVAQFELAQDVCDVRLDRALADDEVRRGEALTRLTAWAPLRCSLCAAKPLDEQAVS
jgi:hypothetical protein